MSTTAVAGKRRGSLEPALRAFINGTLGDAYSTIKLACGLAVLSKLLKLCRTAWMHRAGGVQALVRYIVARMAPLLKRLPMVRRQLDGEMEKLKADLEADIQKDLTAPWSKLPQAGQAQQALLELMKTRQTIDTQYWQPGKMTGAIYHGDLSYMAWVGEIYGMFAFTNPLHMKLHPATRQMESEVIAMVLARLVVSDLYPSMLRLRLETCVTTARPSTRSFCFATASWSSSSLICAVICSTTSCPTTA